MDSTITEPITVIHSSTTAEQVQVWKGSSVGPPTSYPLTTPVPTTYRILHPDEWDKVAPIFEQNGSRLPSPDYASIAVAEQDGEIIGFLTLQPMLHVDPVWLAEHKGKDSYIQQMLHVLEGVLNPIIPEGETVDLFVFSKNPHTGRMAKEYGFEHTPIHVWKKTLKGE